MANTVTCIHPEIRNSQCLGCGVDTSVTKEDWIEYYIDDGFPLSLAEEFAEVEMSAK